MLDKLVKKKYFYEVLLGVLLALSFAIVLTRQHVAGAVFFGCLSAISLVLFSDLTVFLAPTLLLSTFATECYDSFQTFIKFLPLAIPLAICVIFNIVKYRRKVNIGPTFWGLVAVTVSVTLGGVGTLPKENYFSPTSLYYVFFLGAGMLLLYLLFSSRTNEDTGLALAKIMYSVGILAAFMIIVFYVRNWENFLAQYRMLPYQPSNNLSTFLMLAMPFPMFFARKRHIDFIMTLVMYVTAVCSGSRAAMIMATVELFILLFAYSFFYEKSFLRKLLYIGIGAAIVLVVLKYLPVISLRIIRRSLAGDVDTMTFIDCVNLIKRHFISPNEARLRFLAQLPDDFFTNPIFGVGIGYTGNTKIYSPVQGAMNWYHMWTAQIIGGLGTVGIFCYVYQLFGRIKTFFKNRSPFNMTLFLSYMGLFLMSQDRKSVV